MSADRYARQITLPDVGPAGQARLASASVLVVGAGGLGSPVSTYLAAMGVGRIGLIDGDRVDETNLHRQVLYTAADVGRSKVETAAYRLRAMNPDVQVETYAHHLDPSNALDIISRYDIVADGTDAFGTRYLVNDACVIAGVPNAYASVNRFEGQASVFATPAGPCYRCVFPEPPPAGTVPSCAEAGVLGVVPGLMGMIQATEVAKHILGIGDSLVGRLLLVDAASMRFRTVALERDPACPACGAGRRLLDLDTFAADYQIDCAPMQVPEMTVRELHERQEAGSGPAVIDVRRHEEYAAANLGAKLIPMNELVSRIGELEELRGEQFVVHCRSGSRSAQVVEYLRAQGFDAVNLKGGIRAWAAEIDPTLRVA